MLTTISPTSSPCPSPAPTDGPRSTLDNAEGDTVNAIAFADSRQRFEEAISQLADAQTRQLEHAELEQQLKVINRELTRSMLQDHLRLRALMEAREQEVMGADQVPRRRVEPDHTRSLGTIFGEVEVERLAYRAPKVANLYPADAILNLPEEKHSHGLRELAAIEATRGSFDEAGKAITRATGVRVGKRQVEQLTAAAAVDILDYYAATRPASSSDDDLLVLSCDGKGVVMRPEGLREQTRKAADASEHKLATRLSQGEKRNRKRMAEVGAVYDCAPRPRTSADIIAMPKAPDQNPERPRPAPRAHGKWLTASVVESIDEVVAEVFDEAARRDPEHRRTCVALVDGNPQQIARVETEALNRRFKVNLLIDFIHVLEYIWKAAWCFFEKGDQRAEAWVATQARNILEGNCSRVAGAIRVKATRAQLSADQRKGADACADYLLRKRPYLDYPRALEEGWPIATGVIEGACRYLVKDRMDLTGARWSLQGAEAVLRLRALVSNGDFNAYWRYHLEREHMRVHRARYAGADRTNSQLPNAA